MRELDELLLRYLDTVYEFTGDTEKAAFHAVLALSDPELNGYLLQQQEPPPELAGVIGKIRSGLTS
jgi:succinate dehydrogenase flavin-adding protein (antitoxin of CptAB toxin-antitoxin module)